MVNAYYVSLSDGSSFNVETPHHHDDHTDARFKAILLDIIKQSTSSIISGVVVGFVHKGRK